MKRLKKAEILQMDDVQLIHTFIETRIALDVAFVGAFDSGGQDSDDKKAMSRWRALVDRMHTISLHIHRRGYPFSDLQANLIGQMDGWGAIG